MTAADGLRVAFRALAANKLRTALTLLGMVIGVAAVITLMSIGAGVQTSIEERIRELERTCYPSAPAPAVTGSEDFVPAAAAAGFER